MMSALDHDMKSDFHVLQRGDCADRVCLPYLAIAQKINVTCIGHFSRVTTAMLKMTLPSQCYHRITLIVRRIHRKEREV